MENYRPGNNNYSFKTLLAKGQNSDDPVWQEVLDGLRSNDKEWKIIKKELTPCRHPGVRDKSNRCVFCRIEARIASETTAEQTLEEAKAHHVKTLLEKATELDNQAAMIRLEAMEIEMGTKPFARSVSRAEAVANGLKWYLPITPCRHCGIVAEKYVANGRCRNCGK